ncbi:HD family hydrolase [Paenibacillus yanchengensis]|uniref:HD family hydrolase n=1 Tax=Paenibacillus yanchengensis TaxID=2035833 RepID=A0ABW4YMC9_9BACL
MDGLDKKLQAQLAFLIEIDKLKLVERKTKLIHENRLENVAEHSWHIALLAIVLHTYADQPVQLDKVIQTLLIHDIVEIDAGDTFAYDTSGYADKEEREQKAADRIFGLLPEEQAKQMMEVWYEFERNESAEAKFATSLDRLQPIIHNYMNDGDSWQTYQVTSEQVKERMKGVEGSSKKLWELTQYIINDSIESGKLMK